MANLKKGIQTTLHLEIRIMKKFIVISCGVFVAIMAAVLTFAADQEKTSDPLKNTTATEHHVMNPADLKWNDVPPGLPPGAKMAVLNGDPTKPGPFTVRMNAPAGYIISPHTHPSDERLTVISGSFRIGMGDKPNDAFMKEMSAGGYTALPAGMVHYAKSKVDSIVQIDSEGPFQINYVNPADDPRNKESKK